VAVGCLLQGASRIVLLNRTVEKAEELVRELREKEPRARAVEWVAAPLEEGFRPQRVDWATVDVVMQMTSVGMHGEGGSPVDVNLLPEHCHVLEAVYAPLETDFLRGARVKGLRATDGLAMLMEQGALAFEFWFGVIPDRALMRAALQAGRSGRQ